MVRNIIYHTLKIVKTLLLNGRVCRLRQWSIQRSAGLRLSAVKYVRHTVIWFLEYALEN